VLLPAGAASSAPRSKLERAHAAAALTLSTQADPGDLGVWECATPQILQVLPRHYMYSRCAFFFFVPPQQTVGY